MKLLSFMNQGRIAYGAAVEGDRVVDLSRHLGDKYPHLRDLLSDAGRKEAAEVVQREANNAIPMAGLTLLPPVHNPAKIICVGLNYKTHIEEANQKTPEHPMIFFRMASSLVAHGAPIIRPLASERLDFEGELAVVIGEGGRRIPRSRGYEHVAGYTCFNDGSIRDWQRHSTQWGPGKNFPSTGGCGPWVVTRDEIEDIGSCELVTRLNDQEMQRAFINDLLFDVPALIEYCSSFTRLETGDIIVTGTTGGVGGARQPPVWMRPGDRIEVSISGIGTLLNPVVAEEEHG